MHICEPEVSHFHDQPAYKDQQQDHTGQADIVPVPAPGRSLLRSVEHLLESSDSEPLALLHDPFFDVGIPAVAEQQSQESA